MKATDFYILKLIFAQLSLGVLVSCTPSPDAGAPNVGSSGDPSGSLLGVFAPENGYFTLLAADSNEANARARFQISSAVLWGGSRLPVAGHFDGASEDSVGFFDTKQHKFFLKYSNSMGEADVSFVFDGGNPLLAVIPLAGDFNGDGRTTVGVYVSATNRFYLRNSNSAGPADIQFAFGSGLVIPFAGDFDGDGIDTVGVYNYATGVFELRNSNSAGSADVTFQFGSPNMYPIFGDWNNDGLDTVGVFDFAQNKFSLRDSNSAGSADIQVTLAPSRWSWTPVAGRWKNQSGIAEDPGFNWTKATPASQNMNATLLSNAVTAAANSTYMRSLLVVRNGVLVTEEYFGGNRAEIHNNIKSVSKSIISALGGIAQNEGLLPSMNATVASYLPQYFSAVTDARKFNITLAHLLTMSSGINGVEDQIGQMMASSDWNANTLARSMSTDPGTAFNYYTGVTHLFGTVLSQVSGKSLAQYANEKLFTPLGIKALRWDLDPSGANVGGAEVWMRPRDMARFGHLYLMGGTLGGQSIVPASWVAGTTAALFNAGGGTSYGGSWWTKTLAGRTVFYALGFGGQYVMVVPSQQLVVVIAARSDVTYAQSGQACDGGMDIISNFIIPAAN